MKVLLRRNVYNLGKIGEVVTVKPGYARNYLLPQGLAVQPTEANVRKVEEEKEAYLAELARLKEELQAKAQVIDGKEVTIEARANEEGHLYGSVGPAQIVAAFAEQDVFIEPKNVLLPHPIRELDKHEVPVRFGEDVTATVVVWVVRSQDSDEPYEEPEDTEEGEFADSEESEGEAGEPTEPAEPAEAE